MAGETVEFTIRIKATYVMSPESLKHWYGQTAESLAADLLTDTDEEIKGLVEYDILGYEACRDARRGVR
jgi:hypothetical protein